MSSDRKHGAAGRRPGPGAALATAVFFIAAGMAANRVCAHLLPAFSHDAQIAYAMGATVTIEGLAAVVLVFLFPGWMRNLLNDAGRFADGFGAYFRFLPFFLAMMALYVLLMTAVGLELPVQRIAAEILRIRSFPVMCLVVVTGCVCAPFLEEVIFRGVVHSGLRALLPPAASVTASAVLFAAAHQEPAGYAGLFAIGVLLAILLETHETLWASVGFHAANNICAMATILALKALRFAGPALPSS